LLKKTSFDMTLNAQYELGSRCVAQPLSGRAHPL
jgi:hypothetical protein